MSDDEIVSRILNGQERVWRFTDKEQSGSADIADRLLWLGILRAERELAAAVFGSVCAGTGQSVGDAPSPCRFLKTLAQPLPKTFEALTEDPDGPVTPVSRFGKRKEDMPGQFFD